MIGVESGVLRNLIDRFSGQRLLVIGDVTADRTLWCDATGLSAEAPVPVVRVRDETEVLGMAGNVAVITAGLGARTWLAGIRGRGERGERLQERLAKRGLSGELIVDPQFTTPTRTRVVAGGGQLVRVERESRRPPGGVSRSELLTQAKDVLREVQGLILVDGQHGTLNAELLQALSGLTAPLEIPIVVAPATSRLDRYPASSVFVMSTADLTAVARRTLYTGRDVTSVVRQIRRETGVRAVLATRGADGVMLFDGDQPSVSVPATPREVYDGAGARDAVVAVMALALVAGGDLAQAARLANRAGGLAVGRLGNAEVAADELRAGFEAVTKTG